MSKRKSDYLDYIDEHISDLDSFDIIGSKKQKIENTTFFDDMKTYNISYYIFSYKYLIKKIIKYINNIKKNYNGNISSSNQIKDRKILIIYLNGCYKLKIPINIIYNILLFKWNRYHSIEKDILTFINHNIITNNKDMPFKLYSSLYKEFNPIFEEIYTYISSCIKPTDSKSYNLCSPETQIDNICSCNICSHKNSRKLIDYQLLYVILIGLLNTKWNMLYIKNVILLYFSDESWHVPKSLLKICL